MIRAKDIFAFFVLDSFIISDLVYYIMDDRESSFMDACTMESQLTSFRALRDDTCKSLTTILCQQLLHDTKNKDFAHDTLSLERKFGEGWGRVASIFLKWYKAARFTESMEGRLLQSIELKMIGKTTIKPLEMSIELQGEKHEAETLFLRFLAWVYKDIERETLLFTSLSSTQQSLRVCQILSVRLFKCIPAGVYDMDITTDNKTSTPGHVVPSVPTPAPLIAPSLKRPTLVEPRTVPLGDGKKEDGEGEDEIEEIGDSESNDDAADDTLPLSLKQMMRSA